jgi:hypothetical protein
MMKFSLVKYHNSNNTNGNHSWMSTIYILLVGAIVTSSILVFHLSVSCYTNRIVCVDAFSKTPTTIATSHVVGVNRRKFNVVHYNNDIVDEILRASSIMRQMSPSSDSSNDMAIATTSTAHIVFPGGGIYFYWYAGVVSFLRENQYDLASCTYSGASAGALAATLTGLDVNFYTATELALQLAEKAGVWDRKWGLQWIWGPLIEDWLDALVPDSIQPIQGRVTLLVTPIPSLGKVKIHNYIDKQDLIRANLASVHLVREE